jgi:hypothetical protein
MRVTTTVTNMRTYIFTEKEKQQLQNYLDSGTKEEGFRVLLFRIKNYYPSLIQEYDLMTKIFETLK